MVEQTWFNEHFMDGGTNKQTPGTVACPGNLRDGGVRSPLSEWGGGEQHSVSRLCVSNGEGDDPGTVSE